MVATVIVVFFVKRALERREKQETKTRETLGKYAQPQESALLTAYRNLYEKVDMRELSQKQFLKLISEADELIMKPFTDYRSDLPPDLQARIYDDIHNDLAQFKPDPTFPREIEREAIVALFEHRERFQKKIESVVNELHRYK
jgi:hypothetical protein